MVHSSPVQQFSPEQLGAGRTLAFSVVSPALTDEESVVVGVSVMSGWGSEYEEDLDFSGGTLSLWVWVFALWSVV